ncbi:TetR family transcriptional regulator [Neptunomonas antarctica]|uniref:Transcriptional regulator, TetR family n=1 Tax=Neptunomonas antarctica TaxID=619304 RepID=A0A1N7LHE6_9GAMM|nr:TetR family transcriptional regulator [Neptunomonas antarctica]SIS73258.1 transcriptional regulator, TetR family [Neptunomonas antarctica]
MSKKKQQLIEIALNLFMNEGFHATGIDRIVEVSGISKTTLYRHFESKEILIRDALLVFSQRQQAGWQRDDYQLLSAEQLMLARFDELEALVKSQHFSGCIFLNASGEYPDEDNFIHKVAIAHKVASLAETKRRLAFIEDADIEGSHTNLASIIELLYEGLVARLQVQQDLGLITTAKKAVAALLKAKE